MTVRAANEYGFVNARIRGMKSRFLTIGTYENLLQTSSYSDFIKILSSTYYGAIIKKQSQTAVPSPDDLGLILAQDYADVSTSLSRTLSGKVRDFSDTYLEMFFAESIKSIIRGLHVGLEKDEILRFSVPTSPAQAAFFQMLVDSGSVQRMIDLLSKLDLKVALLTRMPSYQEFDSTAPLEVAVEEWYLRKVLKGLREFPKDDRDRVFAFLDPRVILRNVLTGLRATLLELEPRALEISLVRYSRAREINESILNARNWRDVLAVLNSTKFAQQGGRLTRLYEETSNLEGVELAIEDFIAQRTKRQMTAFPFHLGTIIGFFSLKQYEIRNIRSIAVGIERGESAETIRRMITIW
jgi:V/A-type H+-transporting ATPase subunit C